MLDIEVRAKFIEINKDRFIFCIWRDISEFRKIIREKEELIGELKSNMAEFEKLRQIVDICPACKRICDDDGNWEPIENYMPSIKQLQARGMCPACMKKKKIHI